MCLLTKKENIYQKSKKVLAIVKIYDIIYERLGDMGL